MQELRHSFEFNSGLSQQAINDWCFDDGDFTQLPHVLHGFSGSGQVSLQLLKPMASGWHFDGSYQMKLPMLLE